MAVLPRPVIMMMLVIPEWMASSTPYCMMGLSTSGNISLGWALVAGRKRVPRPAAGKTALRTFAAGIRFYLEGWRDIWQLWRGKGVLNRFGGSTAIWPFRRLFAAPSRSRFGNALLIPHTFRAARVRTRADLHNSGAGAAASRYSVVKDPASARFDGAVCT